MTFVLGREYNGKGRFDQYIDELLYYLDADENIEHDCYLELRLYKGSLAEKISNAAKDEKEMLTGAEIQFLETYTEGAILVEHPEGKIDVDYFEDPEVVTEKWEEFLTDRN